MSYFSISEEHMNEPMTKVRDHNGSRNPHYNKSHSQEAKAAISAKQRQRYEMLRQIVDNKTISEERVREIVRETVADYIKNNATPVENNKPIDIRI